jgi:uncharacterized RDD family membrane protein YckC
MPTNCPYCRTANDASENRCARCGRRLHGTSARPAAAFSGAPASAAATAFALDRESLSSPQGQATTPGSAPAPLAPLVPGSIASQPSLFVDLPGGPKVVPIPTLSPMRPSSPLDRESVRRNAARSAARVQRQPGDLQQPLDLQERQGQIRSRPEEALYCDARVALPAQRAVAAGLDGIAVLAGTGMFLGAAFFAGVDFGTLGNLLLLPAAMTAVVAVLYRGLWCLANRDTPGMRFAGLRLVDFDGRAPRRDRRIVRQFAGLLSLLSAGVGLVWALVDEERLTWHDHISKTFPTTA